MPKIDERIRDIDKTICQNIDLIDFETVSRALVSQNLLSQSRNLVEHVAVKAYADANPRMYVHKVVPFVSGEAVYYEIVLTPAYDTTSKFDRFVCYSKIMIPSHYSAKMDIYYETIEVNGRKMPVNILTDFMVSIRPCELNNFAKIFGDDIKMSPSHSEYIGMMQYLSNSGASLLDIVTAPRDIYNLIKQKMFG